MKVLSPTLFFYGLSRQIAVHRALQYGSYGSAGVYFSYIKSRFFQAATRFLKMQQHTAVTSKYKLVPALQYTTATQQTQQ